MDLAKVITVWIELQDSVNRLIDSSKSLTYEGQNANSGIRQVCPVSRLRTSFGDGFPVRVRPRVLFTCVCVVGAAAGAKGGPVPYEHDGQARELRRQICHFTGPVHRHGSDWRPRTIRQEADVPRASGTTAERLPLACRTQWSVIPTSGIRFDLVVQTNWNAASLRQMVQNGPDVHPGANFVEDESGNLTDLSTS